MIDLNSVTVRKALPEDASKLSVLFMQVYIHNYALAGVSGEYANFVSKHFSAERILRTIAEDPEAIVVAEYNNNLIGVAELGFNRACPYRNIIATELDKLYVLERFCGMGIGSKLLLEAEQISAGRGSNHLWVYVWEHNPRAIAFYTKKGFGHLGLSLYEMEVNTYCNFVMLKSTTLES